MLKFIIILLIFLPHFFRGHTFFTGVLDAAESVSKHQDLIKKVYFPRELLPLATTIANLRHFMLSLGVIRHIPNFYLCSIDSYERHHY